VERTPVLTTFARLVRGFGACPGARGIERDHGIHRGVVPADPIEVGIQHIAGRPLAFSDPAGQLGERHVTGAVAVCS
jgi:hypothetical protein